MDDWMHPPPDRPPSNVPRMCVLMALIALIVIKSAEPGRTRAQPHFLTLALAR